MKDLELAVLGVEEMNENELQNVDGGGEWSWLEAGACYLLLGPTGVAIYYLGYSQY